MNGTDSSLNGIRFPDRFIWGVATSSYQIEGATSADGRGESIWDRFCSQPGRIADGSDGTQACQHYRRWRDDVALIADLNVDAYRFSVAWPRVLPEGDGPVNGPGLDFYDQLVDGLLGAGIAPLPTLYHWDLPQALQDRGGWTDRRTSGAFADYAEAVVGRLGDRVGSWVTLNEPFVSADHGHVTGEHAPGHQSMAEGLTAAHHLLVAHGLAGQVVRSIAPDADLGIVLNFTPVTPASLGAADREAADRVDAWENRWYVEPVAGLEYPEPLATELGWDRSEILAGDLDLISQPLDFLGVNYYTRQVVSADPDREQSPEFPVTDMGWEIHPDSLAEQLRTLHDRYRFARYLITENGAAMPDRVRDRGRIADDDRITYLRDHLGAVHDAITAGVPVDGYFAWSAFDNFEWAHGYEKRFGLIEIDFDTMARTPKKSALWYAEVARTGSVG